MKETLAIPVDATRISQQNDGIGMSGSPSFDYGREECARKVRHATRYIAELALEATRGDRPEALAGYYCKFCDGWHNGHPRGRYFGAWEPVCKCGHIAERHDAAQSGVGCRMCHCGRSMPMIYRRVIQAENSKASTLLRQRDTLGFFVKQLLKVFPRAVAANLMQSLANEYAALRAKKRPPPPQQEKGQIP